jgi:hypothetical protein
MKFTPSVVASIVLAGLSFLASISADSVQAASWQTAGGGNWNDPANWNPGNVPDTATEAAAFPTITSALAPHIIIVDDTMYPGGLTTGSINADGVYAQLSRSYIIQATGSSISSPLDWTLANAASIQIRYHQLILTNTNLDLLGTSAGNTIQISSAVHGWNLDATNSSINMTAAPSSSTASGLSVQNSGTMRMTGGNLTIINDDGDAQITVSGTDINTSLPPALLQLDGTAFSTNQLNLSSGGTFTFDGAGASPANVSGSLNVSSGGTANLNSGTIGFGSILLDINGTSSPSNVDVNGATVNVAGAVLLKTTNNTTTPTQPNQLNITAGSLTANSLEASGSSTGKGAFEVNVSGTGSLVVAGKLQLGYSAASNRHGAGTLIISGGSVSANSLLVGTQLGSGSTPNSSGFYEQTGGVASLGSIQLSRDNGTNNYGTQEFVVGSDAELRITGAGFSQIGSGEWHVDDAPGLLDFSGTLVFNPTSLTSQTLLAFGKELTGEKPITEDGISDLIQGNYGIGTLDLSGLDGSEVLHVLPAFNETYNALYIDALLGLTDAEAASHLDSTLNIYYSASSSPLLNGQTISLLSGGSLIALTVVPPAPEPSSLLLISLGGCLGLIRRRGRTGTPIQNN